MQIYTESTHNLNAEFVPSVNTECVSTVFLDYFQ